MACLESKSAFTSITNARAYRKKESTAPCTAQHRPITQRVMQDRLQWAPISSHKGRLHFSKGLWGVECTLADIGTGGPSNSRGVRPQSLAIAAASSKYRKSTTYARATPIFTVKGFPELLQVYPSSRTCTVLLLGYAVCNYLPTNSQTNYVLHTCEACPLGRSRLGIKIELIMNKFQISILEFMTTFRLGKGGGGSHAAIGTHTLKKPSTSYLEGCGLKEERIQKLPGLWRQVVLQQALIVTWSDVDGHSALSVTHSDKINKALVGHDSSEAKACSVITDFLARLNNGVAVACFLDQRQAGGGRCNTRVGCRQHHDDSGRVWRPPLRPQQILLPSMRLTGVPATHVG
eukprot:1181332-Prorocentrum_minimum.AAC.2